MRKNTAGNVSKKFATLLKRVRNSDLAVRRGKRERKVRERGKRERKEERGDVFSGCHSLCHKCTTNQLQYVKIDEVRVTEKGKLKTQRKEGQWKRDKTKIIFDKLDG